MQALTELEIKLLIKGGAQIDDLKLVRVNHKKKAYYQIEFTLRARDSKTESILITTRNEPHRWVDLGRAVTHLEKLFPETSKLTVIFK